GSDAKVRLCHELGADEVIQYKTENEVARIRDLAPDGVHVWFETLREPNFDRAIDLLAEKGRMIVMAGRDARPPFPVGPFYVKGCRLFGFVMFKATPEEQQRAATDINRWLVEGRLRPRIDRIVRLEETPAMHALQEANTIQGTGTISGKIVVRM
ncbi:MAG: zinc-binding dehydrogenase, partial [Pirellulales bacterium]|nr:zinc-binding dehydrogenase [Pirellulales bacterium]